MSATLTRRDAFKYAGISLAGVALTSLGLISARSAYAATVNKLDSSKGLINLNKAIQMTTNNVTYSWGSTKGKLLDNGHKLFFLPVKRIKGGFSYTDLITFTFLDNKIGDRAIKITIEVTKLEVATNRSPNASDLSGYFLFATLTNSAFWFQNYTSASIEAPYSGYINLMYRWYVDYTVTITWADTGEVVDLPFYQVVTDIDAGGTSSYYRESFTGGAGFSGTYYVYNNHRLNISGSTFSTPDKAGSLSGSSTTDIQKGTVIALTNNGQFSGRFQMGNCGNYLRLFSSIGNLENPKKTFELIG